MVALQLTNEETARATIISTKKKDKEGSLPRKHIFIKTESSNNRKEQRRHMYSNLQAQ